MQRFVTNDPLLGPSAGRAEARFSGRSAASSSRSSDGGQAEAGLGCDVPFQPDAPMINEIMGQTACPRRDRRKRGSVSKQRNCSSYVFADGSRSLSIVIRARLAFLGTLMDPPDSPAMIDRTLSPSFDGNL